MPYDAVKREHCPKCGGEAFRNNFLLRTGHHARVFVECVACETLVARYILHAYVDPNDALSSTLSRLRHVRNDESARNIIGEMKVHQDRARVQFMDVKARIEVEEVQEKIISIIQREGIREDG